MIAGHLGLAAAVKAKAPSTPLWAMMLATLWLDVVFVPLVVLGIERFEPMAGAEPGAYGQLHIFADYTHSLVGALVLSGALAALARLRYHRHVAVTLGLTSFSHWLLDLLVHRTDMPVYPNQPLSFPLLGVGLWQYPHCIAAVEFFMVAGGAFAYWRAAQKVAGTHPDFLQRAKLCSVAVFVLGSATLGMNYLGY